MTLEKAIEILQLNIKEAGKTMPPDTLKSVHLGVEAIKFVQATRTGRYFTASYKLPGETPDG